ncbi:MAG: hypothetical protein H6710_24505 [Myxococcales bacterium]|nr:hypothetical protein [Myxococcales bacterium]MCB9702375.1 hypothetical protein [Myxococcales bacterium]
MAPHDLRLRIAFAFALVGAVGCIFDNPSFDGDAASNAASAATSESATASSSSVSASASTSSGDPTSTTAALCPAVAALASVYTDDPTCASCLESTCCDAFTGCAGVCPGALHCALNEACLSEWPLCPGFDEAEMQLYAATECMSTSCFDACNLGPCAAEETACKNNAACEEITSCADACNRGCAPQDGACWLTCQSTCKQSFPAGADDYDAVWTCVATQCG